MAITNGYATQAEFKTWKGITSSDWDDEIDMAVEAASRWIDRYTNRYFWDDSGATKYYTAIDHDICIVDDLQSVTTLKTDSDGDRTYEDTWTSSDYDLMPFQQPNSEPYTYIETAPNGDYVFPSISKGVEVVGDFGWSAIPEAINGVCLVIANRFFSRKDSVYGIAGTGRMGEVVMIDSLDPTVKKILDSYKRITF